jgi:NAD(P)H-hydrate epimerase
MRHLTRAQLREIDRLAGERYHIPGIVLMENAARAVADEACRMLGGECVGEILILCGGGNNGGDGLAVARHMHNRGAEVAIGLLTDPARYDGDALVNWQIAQAMELPAAPFARAMLEDPRPMLIIDAVFGTGLTKPPRDPFPHVASIINHAGVPVLAVDLPSGLDCDTGIPPGACIAAACTVTFVAEKVGFAKPQARQYLGQVVVGDIGCPRELIEAVSGYNPPESGASRSHT